MKLYRTRAGFVCELEGSKYFCGNVRPTKTQTKIPLVADFSRMEQTDEGTKFIRLRAPQDLELINKLRKILFENITVFTGCDII